MYELRLLAAVGRGGAGWTVVSMAGIGSYCLTDRDPGPPAVDHVLLSYHYLNVGDIDGFGSLLDQNVVARGAGLRLSGRATVERFERESMSEGRPCRQVMDVMASGRMVIALGRFDQGGRPGGRDFIEVFMTSDAGLISERRTFILASP